MSFLFIRTFYWILFYHGNNYMVYNWKRCWRLIRRDGLHVTSWLFRAATNLSSAIMLKRAKICRRAGCGRGGRGALPGWRLDVLLVTVRGKSSHCEPTWRHRLHHCHAAFHFNFPLPYTVHCTMCILLHWGHLSALVLGLQNSFKSSKRHFNWSRLLVHWGVQGKHFRSALRAL